MPTRNAVQHFAIITIKGNMIANNSKNSEQNVAGSALMELTLASLALLLLDVSHRIIAHNSAVCLLK
jgi:hypothetical protein